MQKFTKFVCVVYESRQKQMLINCTQVVVDSISTQKADASVKGTITNILKVFFVAYNISATVSCRFIIVD